MESKPAGRPSRLPSSPETQALETNVEELQAELLA
jgi:hypothetical protein